MNEVFGTVLTGLSSSLPLVQLIVQRAVFTAAAWPPTPASVSQAGGAPTAPVVSLPAAAVCEQSCLCVWALWTHKRKNRRSYHLTDCSVVDCTVHQHGRKNTLSSRLFFFGLRLECHTLIQIWCTCTLLPTINSSKADCRECCLKRLSTPAVCLCLRHCGLAELDRPSLEADFSFSIEWVCTEAHLQFFLSQT